MVLTCETLLLPKGAKWPASGTVIRVARGMINIVTPRGRSTFAKKEWFGLFKKNNPDSVDMSTLPPLNSDETYYVV